MNEVSLNGFRVDTEEIRSALKRHAALADAAVVLRNDASGESRLAAYIVLRAGESATATELRDELRRTLPRRMIPRTFTEVDELRRASAGEWRLDETETSVMNDHVDPRSATEQMLARVWRAALGVDRVGVHDNFFSLGGYSLLCFQVIDRVERETGHRLSPRLLLLDSLQQVAESIDRVATNSATVLG
jgi:hypothetical protein